MKNNSPHAAHRNTLTPSGGRAGRGAHPQPLASAGEKPQESSCRDYVWVRAENADAAHDAFSEWLTHVEAGRIG